MDVDEQIELVRRRTDFLTALEGRRLDPRELCDRTGDSRATVNRAFRELEEAGLVDREEGSYGLTAAGRLALDHHRRHRRERADLLAAEPLLSDLPGDVDLDVETVVGGEVVLAPEATPYRPVQRLHRIVDDADRYRALLPALDDPKHVRLLYEHVVTDGNEAELVVPDALYDSLAAEFPRRLAAMAGDDAGTFDLLVGDTPDVGVVLTGTDDDLAVTVIVPGSDGGIRALVCNDSSRAVRWATDRYERVRSGASSVVDDLRQVEDGGVVVGDPGPGQSGAAPGLLVALEREGFVRLSRDYLLDREVAPPSTAWRAGLDLAEVHTGYAVDRTGDEGTTLSERLVDGLVDGGTHALVGPPGSGKSTTAKRVACEWYDRDLGPVFYREHGRGTAFSSTEELAATIDAADGHPLVVVEDAVRPDAEAVFEVAARFADRDDVSFLVEARESEWRDPAGDPPIGAVDPHVEPMPGVLDGDLERLVEHFERTAGVAVEVPLAELRERVRAAREGDGAAPGGILLVLHRLATYVDPLAEGPTSLEADAAAVYETLLERGDRALDVGVAANVLNAAGIAPGPVHLGAVADDDAVEAATDCLDGRVLFGLDPDGTYRTVHEAWSTAFLTRLLDAEGPSGARERVERGLSGVLALADDPEFRDRVGRGAPNARLVDRIAADPTAWADDTVDRLLALGEQRPKLAPLFGDADGPTLVPPAAAESVTTGECTARLGRMFLAGGAFDEARSVAKAGLEDVPERSETRCRLLGVLARAQVEQGDYDVARETAERLTELDAGKHRRRALSLLGRIARERGRYDRAEDRLERALSLARAAGDRRTEAGVLEELGRVAYTRGAYDLATEYHEESLAVRRELGDRRGRADSLGNLGNVYTKRGEYDGAEEAFERALSLQREIGDRHGESNTLGNLGVVYKRRGEYDRARELFERDLAIKRELGDREGEATVLRNLGNVAYLRGEYDRVEEYEERSLAIKRELGDRHGQAASLSNLGLVAQRRGDFERAHERYERSLGIAREIGDRQGEADTLGNLGTVAQRRGRFERAREYHRESLTVCRDVGDRRGEAGSLVGLGSVARECGEDDRARERYGEGLAIARELDDPRLEGAALVGLAAVDRRRGDYERAGDRLDRATSLFEDIDAGSFVGRARLEAGRLALAEGDPERAADLAATARDAFEELDEDFRRGRSLRFLGRAAKAAGRREEAREHWRNALETFEALDAPHEVLSTLELLVETGREAGDDADTREWCRRARSVLAEASGPDLERHREWIDRVTATLDE